MKTGPQHNVFHDEFILREQCVPLGSLGLSKTSVLGFTSQTRLLLRCACSFHSDALQATAAALVHDQRAPHGGEQLKETLQEEASGLKHSKQVESCFNTNIPLSLFLPDK